MTIRDEMLDALVSRGQPRVDGLGSFFRKCVFLD